MQRICERLPLWQKKEGLEIPEIRAIKICPWVKICNSNK